MRNQRPASPELATVDVGGMTRSAFMLRATIAAGAVYGAGTVAPFVRQAAAQDGTPPDLSIVQFALTLEELEATFYQQALQRLGLSGDVRALTEELESNESEHAEALTDLVNDLGGEPETPAGFDFGDALDDEESYLRLAQTLEDTGVSAYNGAATSIQDKQILATAGTIVQVEGRHAALVRAQRGEEIAPTAFDDELAQNEVLNKIEPFIRS